MNDFFVEKFLPGFGMVLGALLVVLLSVVIYKAANEKPAECIITVEKEVSNNTY